MRRTRVGRRSDDRGATLVEYALIVSLVVIAATGAISALESSSSDELNNRTPIVGTPAEQNSLNFGSPSTTLGGATTTTVAPPPGAVVVHVSGITGSAQTSTAGNWVATARITVVDDLGAPVAGISVTGAWAPTTGSATTSCTTDDSGQCNVTQSGMKRSGAGSIPEVVFTVVLLGGGEATYDPAANNTTLVVISAP